MNKKVECIRRLFKKNYAYNEICEWLIEREYITELEMNSYSREQERAEFLYSILEKAETEKKFMLLTYDWQVLPIEQIKIHIVTQTEEKIFSYGY